MANTLRIGLLGPLQVRDEAGRLVHVGGRRLRVLLTLLALDAGRVVPAASLEQVYLRILRGEERPAAVAQATAAASDPSFISAERAVVSPPRTGPGRVPNPLTNFVGRDREVSGVRKNLAAGRLVTLTGPGGVGKTRLAAEACGSLDAIAWFVELAPVTDPSEVAYAVLEAVGVREPVIARRAPEPGAGPLDRLTAALAERDQVLVLDNCEHVIEAAATLAGRVLADCPRMRILATAGSRSASTARPSGRCRRCPCLRPRQTCRASRISSLTDRSACCAIGRPPSGPTSSSTRATRRRWRGSAEPSTGCRWPSSLPRYGCARSRPISWPTARTTGSPC
jgi:hypothetical protein